MICIIRRFFILVLSLLQLSCAIPYLENSEQISEISPRLAFVGQADGKSFFLDESVKMPWNAVRSYCQSLNMDIAAITSKAQILAIATNIYNITGTSYIWSAAKNGGSAPSLDDFSWYDKSNGTEKPNDEFIMYNGYFTYWPSCLLMHASVDQLTFFSDNCNSQYIALCQNP